MKTSELRVGEDQLLVILDPCLHMTHESEIQPRTTQTLDGTDVRRHHQLRSWCAVQIEHLPLGSDS